MSIIAAHHYLSICHLRKQENIAISLPGLQRFDSAFFQTLPNVNVHPGVAVYHTLKIFSFVNAKDLLMPHTKFQVCTLKINTIFCHRKKKIPLLLNRSVHCSRYHWTCLWGWNLGLFYVYQQYVLCMPFLCWIFFWKHKDLFDICIFCHFSNTEMDQRCLKSCFLKDKNPFILHCQYHGSWWPGDTRIQGISSHAIDLILLEYSSFSIRRLSQ